MVTVVYIIYTTSIDNECVNILGAQFLTMFLPIVLDILQDLIDWS